LTIYTYTLLFDGIRRSLLRCPALPLADLPLLWSPNTFLDWGPNPLRQPCLHFQYLHVNE